MVEEGVGFKRVMAKGVFFEDKNVQKLTVAWFHTYVIILKITDLHTHFKWVNYRVYMTYILVTLLLKNQHNMKKQNQTTCLGPFSFSP